MQKISLWAFLILVLAGLYAGLTSKSQLLGKVRSLEICISLKDTLNLLDIKDSLTLEEESKLYDFLSKSRFLGVGYLDADHLFDEDTPSDIGASILPWVSQMGYLSVQSLDSNFDPKFVRSSPAVWYINPAKEETKKLTKEDYENIEKTVAQYPAIIALPEPGIWRDLDRLKLARQFPSLVEKAHTIPLKEMALLKPSDIQARWIRSVKERNVRFLYYHWNQQLTPSENIEELSRLNANLEDLGFTFAAVSNLSINATDSSKILGWLEFPYRGQRQLLALLIAVLFPIAGIYFVLHQLKSSTASTITKWPVLKALPIWFGSVLLAITAGLLIQNFLPDTTFLTGLSTFRGVKVAILLPLLVSGFLIFSWSELKSLFLENMSAGKLIGATTLISLLLFFIVRSGNHPYLVPSVEIAIRSWMEEYFIVRPRFKEFLIGHPLLILGIALSLGTPSHLKDRIHVYFSKFCIWLGSLCWISIINSFCHLHTPLPLTLTRTLFGMGLGATFGLVLYFIFKRIFKSPQSRQGSGGFEIEKHLNKTVKEETTALMK